MTVDNKSFKIKNGLIVQGSSATVDGNQVLTTASGIEDLSNIDITGIADGYALIYNSITQKWISVELPGGSSTVVSETAPASPAEGQLWFNSTNAVTYIYYDSSWVEVSSAMAGPPGPEGPAGDSSYSMGGYESQAYYGAVHIANAGAGTTVESTTYYHAFYVSETTTFDRIACRAGAGFSGTATVRLGIYNNSTNRPSTVLLDAGTVSVTSAATFQITINQEITPGWYWLAFNSQTAAATNNFAHIAPVPTWGYMTTQSNYNRIPARQETGITGPFATAGTLSTAVIFSCPGVLLRAI